MYNLYSHIFRLYVLEIMLAALLGQNVYSVIYRLLEFWFETITPHLKLKKLLCSVQRMYLCVLCGGKNIHEKYNIVWLIQWWYLYIHVTVHRNRYLFNNQQEAVTIKIYSVIKLYMFGASSLPIIRSFVLYIRHWWVSCRFLMTASKQSQDGTGCVAVAWKRSSKNLHETYQCRIYSRKLLMKGREDARSM